MLAIVAFVGYKNGWFGKKHYDINKELEKIEAPTDDASDTTASVPTATDEFKDSIQWLLNFKPINDYPVSPRIWFADKRKTEGLSKYNQAPVGKREVSRQELAFSWRIELFLIKHSIITKVLKPFQKCTIFIFFT